MKKFMRLTRFLMAFVLTMSVFASYGFAEEMKEDPIVVKVPVKLIKKNEESDSMGARGILENAFVRVKGQTMEVYISTRPIKAFGTTGYLSKLAVYKGDFDSETIQAEVPYKFRDMPATFKLTKELNDDESYKDIKELNLKMMINISGQDFTEQSARLRFDWDKAEDTNEGDLIQKIVAYEVPIKTETLVKKPSVFDPAFSDKAIVVQRGGNSEVYVDVKGYNLLKLPEFGINTSDSKINLKNLLAFIKTGDNSKLNEIGKILGLKNISNLGELNKIIDEINKEDDGSEKVPSSSINSIGSIGSLIEKINSKGHILEMSAYDDPMNPFSLKEAKAVKFVEEGEQKFPSRFKIDRYGLRESRIKINIKENKIGPNIPALKDLICLNLIFDWDEAVQITKDSDIPVYDESNEDSSTEEKKDEDSSTEEKKDEDSSTEEKKDEDSSTEEKKDEDSSKEEKKDEDSSTEEKKDDDSSKDDANKYNSNVVYIEGYEDGVFKPDNAISRAEATKILAYALTKNYSKDKDYKNSFNDIVSDAWYAKVVGYMEDIKAIDGYKDGSFKADSPIKRGEFAKIVSLIDGYKANEANKFTDVSKEHWAKKYIEDIGAKGYIKGYPNGDFGAENNITRAEVVAIVNRMIGKDIESFKGKDELNKFSDMNNSHWAYLDVIAATNK